jgi:uncharacterized protein YjiS (DUF1127 family)
MTRLKSQTTGQAPASFGALFSTAAALTSPVQLDRPFYGDVPALAVRGGTRFGHALDTLLLWHERAQQRRHLAQLDHHMLRDIGISRADAVGEAQKPFWRG